MKERKCCTGKSLAFLGKMWMRLHEGKPQTYRTEDKVLGKIIGNEVKLVKEKA
jgi:hypothetical protein